MASRGPRDMTKAWAGRDRYLADLDAVVAAGYLPAHPGRRTFSGERRVAYALELVEKMLEEDREIEALRAAGNPVALEGSSNSENWNKLHELSLEYYRDILTTPVPIDEDHTKLLSLKDRAANKIVSVSAKLQVAYFRGRDVTALANVLRRVKALEQQTPPVVENDRWGLDE